ncbi:hypothetical protein BCR42DRAFT_415579 [Absidia repens]|uniref:PHD-type domain-containing protein n=1 Tax=Absidia repens TaxID=90262 RepID=A0A1X2IFS2_9FUNG|nr:hypothetical protein BCR42DRAFT_415579 [Absidia repens]
MKVPRNTRLNEERLSSIKNKPVFKVAPALSKRTLSLLQSSSSTCPPSAITASSSSHVPSNIQSISNTMKIRMKAAVNTMVWNVNNRELMSSLLSPTINAVSPSLGLQQQQDEKQLAILSSPLANHTLLKQLKQYVSFVQEETGALMEIEPTSTSTLTTNSLPMPSLGHQPHPLAVSGATLIESLVYDPMLKMTELYKQNDTLQKRPTSRSSSDGRDTSKMENDELKTDSLQQTKKSKRLRLKQQQRLQQCQRSSTTDSTATPIVDDRKATATATAGEIRCICDDPHEEFGSMVQCDDCSYWLHLNCLALDEASLDNTYRCPACYVTLGPGEHSANSAVTWRLAAQLKSKKLASRHGSSRDHHGVRKGLGFKRRNPTLKQRREQLRQKQQRRIQYQSIYTAYDGDSYSSSSDNGNDDVLDVRQLQTWMIPKMIIDPSIKTKMTTPTGNVLVQILGDKSALNLQQDNSTTVEENLFDSDTTESDCEFGDDYQLDLSQQYPQGNDYQGSISSSSSSSSVATVPSLVSSPSHASSDMDSTSDEPNGSDDLYALGTTKCDLSILSTTATSACLNQENLLWLSRLAYLESLQSSSKQQCFTPHASDVFLCDDQQQRSLLQTDSHTVKTAPDETCHYAQLATPTIISSRSEPPSTICSHDLSQFSFDIGPFWCPTQHQIVDTCLFF